MYTIADTAPRTSLFDYPAPAGSVIGSAFDQALESNPIPMFMLSREINAARERGPKLTAEDARARAKMAGVSVTVPEDGITAEALGYLVERRRDDADRAVLRARSAGGIGTTAATLGAGFAGALADPLNVAAGFIPVLGGTRYAGMLAEAGTAAARAGIRLGIGAAEGAVGSAIVELPTVGLHRDLQDEYSLYDSLANMAFGTFASAGIRGVSGYARDAYLGMARAREIDAMRAVPAETWEALRLQARNAEERAFFADLEAGFQRGEGIPEGLRVAFARDRFDAESQVAGREFGAAIAELREERTQAAEQAVLEAGRYRSEFNAGMDELRDARAALLREADQAIQRRMDREREKLLAAGMEPDDALREAFRRAHPETERLLKSQADLGAERLSEMGLADARERIATGRGLVLVPSTPRGILGAISDTTHAQALRAAVAQAIEGKRIDVDPIVRSDPIFAQERMGADAVRARALAADDPARKVAADKGASERATLTVVKSRARPKPAKPTEAESPAAKGEPEPSPELLEAQALLEEARIALDAEIVPVKRSTAELLADPDIRQEFAAMKRDTGWAEVGGRMIRAVDTGGEKPEVVGRTSWIPRAEWWPGRPKGLTESKTQKAVDKALAGEPLNKAEQRMVDYMLQIADARRLAERWTAKPEELLAEGLGKVDSFDGALAARAAELDPDGFERLAIQTENDDAAFMRGVKEILDAYDATNPNAKAGEPGQAGERATGEGREGEAGAEGQSPEVKRGEDLADAYRAAGDCAVRGGE